jgi:hypothetical protein
MTTPIRVGLLVDAPFAAWHADCLGQLRKGDAEIAAIVELPPPRPSRHRFHAGRSRRPARRPPEPSSSRCVDHRHAWRTLATRDLDLVIDLTSRPPDVREIDPPADVPFEVWRMGPIWPSLPGAAELANGEATIDLHLERHTPRPAGEPQILRWARLPVRHHSLAATVDLCLGAVAGWPALALADRRSGVALPPPPAATNEHPTRRHPPPSPWQLRARLAGNTLRRWAGFRFSDEWNIGVIDAPIHTLLTGSAPSVCWYPPRPAGTFVADPFAHPAGDGQTTVYAEAFDHGIGVGTLCRSSWPTCAEPEPVAADVPPGTHLSYPFLLREDERLWCIPETAAARSVRLYAVGDDDGELRFVATILDGIAAVDPTVVAWGGRWWLFLTDGDRGDTWWLNAYHADSLLGPWTPHAGNPVKQDVAGARPAGTPFVHGGRLYRPAQDDATTYGAGIVIQRVAELTPTSFVEEPAARIDPVPPYGAGIHTVSAAGFRTVIDGKRRYRDWRVVARKLAVRLRRTGPR